MERPRSRKGPRLATALGLALLAAACTPPKSGATTFQLITNGVSVECGRILTGDGVPFSRDYCPPETTTPQSRVMIPGYRGGEESFNRIRSVAECVLGVLDIEMTTAELPPNMPHDKVYIGGTVDSVEDGQGNIGYVGGKTTLPTLRSNQGGTVFVADSRTRTPREQESQVPGDIPLTERDVAVATLHEMGHRGGLVHTPTTAEQPNAHNHSIMAANATGGTPLKYTDKEAALLLAKTTTRTLMREERGQLIEHLARTAQECDRVLEQR